MAGKDGVVVAASGSTEKSDLDVRIAHELIEKARTEGVSLVGPNGLLQQLTKTVLESALNAELDDHLGYERGDSAGKFGSNERNGSSTKTVRTDVGEVRIEVPRDREGTFTPKIVPKYARRVEGFDEAVISLYAKGFVGKVAPVLGYFSELEVDRFDRVGGVHDLSELWRVVEKQNEFVPGETPHVDRAWVSRAELFVELGESEFGGVEGGCGVDFLHRLDDFLSVAVGHEPHGVADDVHHAVPKGVQFSGSVDTHADALGPPLSKSTSCACSC